MSRCRKQAKDNSTGYGNGISNSIINSEINDLQRPCNNKLGKSQAQAEFRLPVPK